MAAVVAIVLALLLAFATPLKNWFGHTTLNGVVIFPELQNESTAQTQPGVRLKIGETPVPVDQNGQFSLEVPTRRLQLRLSAELTEPSARYGIEPPYYLIDRETSSPIEFHVTRKEPPVPSDPPQPPETIGYERGEPFRLQPPQPILEPPIVKWQTNWVWAGGASLVASILSILALLAYAILRRSLVLKRLPATRRPDLHTLALHAKPFTDLSESQARELVRALRRPRSSSAIDLSVASTVVASAQAGGLFSPQYVNRSQIPEYLLLFGRKSADDHQAKLVDLTIDLLMHYGLSLERYEFYDDPRICRSPGLSNRQYLLAELAGDHHSYTLLLFSESRVLFDPRTGELASWAETIKQWHRRVLFTPEPPAKWTQREWKLAASGMVVLPWTADGLQTYADLAEDWRIDSLFPAKYARAFPSLLAGEARDWLNNNAPGEAVIAKLLRQLRDYLGPKGYPVLRACAVYPQISWPLTLHLAGADREGSSERNTAITLLPQLARLPWFRYTHMPDWLRLALIGTFSEEEETALRSGIEALLQRIAEYTDRDKTDTGTPNKAHGLKIARWIKPTASEIIETSSPDSPLHDTVFIGFMSGARQDRLALSVDGMRRRYKGVGGLPGMGDAGQRRSFLKRLQANLRRFENRYPAWMRGTVGALVGGLYLAVGAAVFQERTIQLPAAPIDLVKIEAAAISADGLKIATANSDGKLTLWRDIPESEPITLPSPGQANALAFSPNGSMLASAILNQNVAIWDLKKRLPRALPGRGGLVLDLAFSPDGKLVASAGKEGSVTLYDLESWQVLSTTRVHDGEVTSVAFSPEGKRLATGSRDGLVGIWTLPGLELVSRGRGADEQNYPRSVVFSPDGRKLASANINHSVMIIGTDTSELFPVLKRHDQPVTSLAFSPNGRTLVSGDMGGNVMLWNIDEKPTTRAIKQVPDTFTPLGDPIDIGAPIVKLALTSLENLSEMKSAAPEGIEPLKLTVVTQNDVQILPLTIRHDLPPAPPRQAHIEVTESSSASLRGNPRGGKGYSDRCAPDELLVGFVYTIEKRGWLGSIGAVCGQNNASPDETGAVVMVGKANQLKMRGKPDGKVARSLCPRNQFVIGFEGRSGKLIDQLALRCAPIEVSNRKKPGAVIGKGETQKPFGGDGGKPFPITGCPAGQIAHGAAIRAGDDVDAIGLMCGTPQVIETPPAPQAVADNPITDQPPSRDVTDVIGKVSALIKDNQLQSYVQEGIFENTPKPEHTGGHDWTYNSWRITRNGAKVQFFLPVRAVNNRPLALRLVYAGWGKQTLINLYVNGVPLAEKHPVDGEAWANPKIDTFEIPEKSLALSKGEYHIIELQLDNGSSKVLFFKELEILARPENKLPSTMQRKEIPLKRSIKSLF